MYKDKNIVTNVDLKTDKVKVLIANASDIIDTLVKLQEPLEKTITELKATHKGREDNGVTQEEVSLIESLYSQLVLFYNSLGLIFTHVNDPTMVDFLSSTITEIHKQVGKGNIKRLRGVPN